MRAIILILVGVLAVAATAAAAETTAPGQIQAAATGFLVKFAEEQKTDGYDVRFTTSHVDARLSLVPCESELAVSFSGDPWKTPNPTLQVSCTGKKPWRMFLPAALSIHGDVLVASRILARGDRITPDMIDTKTTQLNALRREAITDKDMLAGMEVRRSVRAGTVFTADLVFAPDAVQRGDHVMITAQSGAFSVRSQGKALTDARIGEQVLVENLSSSRKVKARVIAPGQVEISM